MVVPADAIDFGILDDGLGYGWSVLDLRKDKVVLDSSRSAPLTKNRVVRGRSVIANQPRSARLMQLPIVRIQLKQSVVVCL